MTDSLQTSEGTPSWEELADRLRQEIDRTDDAQGRVPLLHALARLLLDELDGRLEAFLLLDEAVETTPVTADLAWESLRFSARRGSEQKIDALDRLVSKLERTEDQVSAHLWLARLLRNSEGESDQIGSHLTRAAEIEPENRNVLWAQAEHAARRNDSSGLAQAYRSLSGLTSDGQLRAALDLEVAAIERTGVASRGSVAELLGRALAEPGIGWMVVSDVRHLATQIGNWELVEEALLKLVEAASEEEPDPGDDGERATVFQGFDRGEDAAAALWWELALVRERRRERPEAALEAVEQALELLPGHSFLEWERTRLMEACGRSLEALDIIPHDSSDIWKAELALAAERPEMALSLLLSGRDVSSSILGEVLALVCGDTDASDLDPEADTESKTNWFLTHLGHSGAARVAKELKGEKVDNAAIRLLLWENTRPRGEWPDVIPGETEEAWPLAVEAVLGTTAAGVQDRAQDFLDWTDKTADLSMGAMLISVAARLQELEGGSAEAALELYQRAEEFAPATADSGQRAVKLMREQGRWRDLVDRLSEETALAEDETLSRVALHEKSIILEHALDDLEEAAEANAEIISYAPEDTTAAWSSARLAFRLSNWNMLLGDLERLVTLCPEDTYLLELLSGEINLFAVGNYDDALRHFEQASQAIDPSIAQAARLYSFYVLSQLGDLNALGAALKEETAKTAVGAAGLWLPEILEIERSTSGAGNALDLLGKAEEPVPFATVWQLLAGLDSGDPTLAPRTLRHLSEVAPMGEMSSACRVAASLLDGASPTAGTGLTEMSFESPEVLWHAADRIGEDEDPILIAELCKERALLTGDEGDLERVDWVLEHAEALERAGDTRQALEAIDRELERSGDHPGLLAERAQIARSTEDWKTAADSHGRLARYFNLEEEKAYQLARAALILFEKLGDDKGAQKICEEALRRVPGHPEAHEVYVRVLKRRGDNTGVAELLETRIEAEDDQSELITLWEEKADEMIGLDDPAGALEALDKVLEIDPERVATYLTKMEVLAELGRWEESVATMGEYIARTDDPVEARTTTWRAADLLVEELFEVETALEWLEKLVASGDRHPDTQRQIVSIAKRAERWETAADALTALAELLDDPGRRIPVMREETKIRLEYMYDDESANELVKKILAIDPADMETLKLSLQFRGEETTQAALAQAIKATRYLLDSHPTDMALIAKLKELADLKGEKDLSSLCDDVVATLNGEQFEPWPGDLVPAKDLDAEQQRRLFVHPDETNVASRLAEMSAEIAIDCVKPPGHLPETGRSTRVSPKKDGLIESWIKAWGKLLGYDNVEIHLAGDDPRGAVALPRNAPSLAITSAVESPMTARHRFFIARSLWRSARGLGAFEEGDMAGPARWVVAIAAAILGERIELPLSTDSEIVNRAKKALPRRLKRSLAQPCEQLLKENRQTLRAWAQAISFSADRFGLLAATRIGEVIPLIVEESAGEIGLKKLAEKPTSTILKLPRCRELLRFALSEAYLDARRQVGLTIRFEGGDA